MNISDYYKKAGAIGLVLTVCATASGNCMAQHTLPSDESGRWDFSDSRIGRTSDGNGVLIELSILPIGGLKAQETAILTPVLVSDDGKYSLSLNPIGVAGKKRYKVLRRRRALHNVRPGEPGEGVDTVYEEEDIREKGIRTEQTVPLEKWMSHGRLICRMSYYGCAECGPYAFMDSVSEMRIPLFSEEDVRYDFIEPQEQEKAVPPPFRVRLEFPVASYRLRRDFRRNSVELDRLERFVSSIEGGTESDALSVLVRGYASPEGSFLRNKTLSEHRAGAVARHISERFPVLAKNGPVAADAGGEDWEGLCEDIKSGDYPESLKKEMLSAIASHERDTEREVALKRIENGKQYRSLLRQVYPGLRHADVVINRQRGERSEAELEETFGKDPGALSHRELFRLAAAREDAGKNPTPVYEQAYLHFGREATAILNYANALLKYEGDADRAMEVLKAVENDRRSVRPRATAWLLKGDWKKADRIFRQKEGESPETGQRKR